MLRKVRGLLTAGFILSILMIIGTFIAMIVCFVSAPFSPDEATAAELISGGVRCLVACGFSIFAVVISAIARKKVPTNDYNIALSVLVIVSGAVSNIINIPAGVLMIVAKSRGEEAEQAPEKVEEKPSEEKAE